MAKLPPPDYVPPHDLLAGKTVLDDGGCGCRDRLRDRSAMRGGGGAPLHQRHPREADRGSGREAGGDLAQALRLPALQRA